VDRSIQSLRALIEAYGAKPNAEAARALRELADQFDPKPPKPPMTAQASVWEHLG